MLPTFDFNKVFRYIALFLIIFAIVMQIMMLIYRLTVVSVATALSLAIFPVLPEPLVYLRIAAASFSIACVLFWYYVFNYELINNRVELVYARILNREV